MNVQQQYWIGKKTGLGQEEGTPMSAEDLLRLVTPPPHPVPDYTQETYISDEEALRRREIRAARSDESPPMPVQEAADEPAESTLEGVLIPAAVVGLVLVAVLS